MFVVPVFLHASTRDMVTGQEEGEGGGPFGSTGLVLRLFTSVVLIVSAVLARGAPTAFVILLVLGISSLVLAVQAYRKDHRA